MTTAEAKDYVNALPDNFKDRIVFYGLLGQVNQAIRRAVVARAIGGIPNDNIHKLSARVISSWLPYQRIIGMGPPALPFLLEEALRSPSGVLLFSPALVAITGCSAPCRWLEAHYARTDSPIAVEKALHTELYRFWKDYAAQTNLIVF